jgi:hypothetical protein
MVGEHVILRLPPHSTVLSAYCTALRAQISPLGTAFGAATITLPPPIVLSLARLTPLIRNTFRIRRRSSWSM